MHFGPADGYRRSKSQKSVRRREVFATRSTSLGQTRIKFCTCVLAFAVGSPQAWGADAARVLYHVETVAGSSLIGDGGPALAAQFSNIQGIAVARLGNLYLSDTSNHRVRKVSGGIVTTIAGTGVAGYGGDGGSALNAQLNLDRKSVVE